MQLCRTQLCQTQLFRTNIFNTHTHLSHTQLCHAQLYHTLSHTIFHTLDKNGSLYDPAGTESCNVQIQKIRIAMLITEIKYQIATTVKWKYSCAVLGLAACHVSQNCNEKMQVRPAGQAGYPISLVASLDTVPVKCCVPLHYLKREKREEKRRKFYIYPDVTHTHTHPAEPGKPWKPRGRKKRTHDEQTAKNSAGGGGEQTDLRNQPTRRNGPDQNSAHT